MMMFMLSQKLSAKDSLAGLSMLSLDRLTEGGKGYPLLLESGESYNGVPPVDRQHPHDLFAELAVAYTHSFTKDLDITSYCGYPGEPAYGKSIATSKVLFTYLSTDLALGLQGTINFPLKI